MVSHLQKQQGFSVDGGMQRKNELIKLGKVCDSGGSRCYVIKLVSLRGFLA